MQLSYMPILKQQLCMHVSHMLSWLDGQATHQRPTPHRTAPHRSRQCTCSPCISRIKYFMRLRCTCHFTRHSIPPQYTHIVIVRQSVSQSISLSLNQSHKYCCTTFADTITHASTLPRYHCSQHTHTQSHTCKTQPSRKTIVLMKCSSKKMSHEHKT